MQEKVINLYKPIGPTSLQWIKEYRKHHPRYKNITLGYGGRLDPMAEGILLVIIGDENKKRDKYLKLPKEYEFEILFGFATDTYDALGLIVDHEPDGFEIPPTRRVEEALREFEGKIMQKFPPYSSYTIKGKTLFTWAREGRLHEIEIPSKEREIYDIKLLKTYEIDKEKLLNTIIERVSKVTGPLRQKEIIKKWSEILGDYDTNHQFSVAKCYIACSSGTYVRGIAHELGKKLKTLALAFSIKRTKVGNYRIEDATHLPQT